MSILLHEVTKLLHYAGAKGVTYFRMGTSGGLGIDPCSVVLSTEGLNGLMEPRFSLPILGKMVHRPSKFSPELNAKIIEAAGKHTKHIKVI